MSNSNVKHDIIIINRTTLIKGNATSKKDSDELSTYECKVKSRWMRCGPDFLHVRTGINILSKYLFHQRVYNFVITFPSILT